MATIRPWPRFEVLTDHHDLLTPDSAHTSIVSTWAFAKIHTYIHANFPDDLLPPNIYPTSIFRALHLSPTSPSPTSHPITAAWLAAKPHILAWAAASRTARHWHDVISSSPALKIPGVGSPSELAALHALYDNALPPWLHQLWSLLDLDWVLTRGAATPPFWRDVQFTRVGSSYQHPWNLDPLPRFPVPTAPRGVNTLIRTIQVQYTTGTAYLHPGVPPTAVLTKELPTVTTLLHSMAATTDLGTPHLSAEVAALLARTLEHDRRRMDELEEKTVALRQEMRRTREEMGRTQEMYGAVAKFLEYKFGEVEGAVEGLRRDVDYAVREAARREEEKRREGGARRLEEARRVVKGGWFKWMTD